jgi:hypothetical protein
MTFIASKSWQRRIHEDVTNFDTYSCKKVKKPFNKDPSTPLHNPPPNHPILKKTIICFLPLALAACSLQEHKSTAEAAIIPKEEMIGILAETHLAEAYLQRAPYTSRDSFAAILYKNIFEMHKVEEADFYQSLNAYEQDPESMRDIYEAVTKNIDNQSDTFRSAERKKNEGLQ